MKSPNAAAVQTSCFPARRRRGFTLVELLVSIVIIVVLAAVVVAATRAVQRSANKVSDMNNLRNLAAAAMAAGGDNAGRLPTLHPEGQSAPYWLLSRDTLQSSGIYKEACYAPTRNIQGGAPKYEWWYNYGSQTPTHYAYFANDAASKTNGWFTKGSVTKPDKKDYRGAMLYEDIVKDPNKAFARTVTDDAWYPILWSGLCRDWNGSRLSAIMQNGDSLGVNVMYLDGHTEWVPRKKMKIRYTAGSLNILW